MVVERVRLKGGDDFERLRAAVVDLYLAGRWTCDRPANEAALWEAVRDAAGIAPGTATKSGVQA